MMRKSAEIQTELAGLSTILSEIPVKQVFTVPGGYFEHLPDLLLDRIKRSGGELPAEEIEQLSPLLAGLSRKMPQSVPEGYFNDIPLVMGTEQPGKAPVVTMQKRRFSKFAIAASMIAILGFGALLFQMLGKDPVILNVAKELPKVSEKEMDEFLDGFPDIALAEPIVVAGNTVDIEGLVSEIDEQGLEEFLSDQPDLTPLKMN